MTAGVSHAVFAAYVAAYKVGPDEFFPIVTTWRIDHPLEGFIPGLAMLVMGFAALALTAYGTRLRQPLNVICGLAFPWTIAAYAVLPNAPRAFSAGYGIVCVALTAALFLSPTLGRARAR